MIESWELTRPAPIIWPDTTANRESYAPRMETPLVVTPDWGLWEYRRQNGLTWADLTGVWPQPPWRTQVDRQYQSLWNQAQHELAERTTRRA